MRQGRSKGAYYLNCATQFTSLDSSDSSKNRLIQPYELGKVHGVYPRINLSFL